MFLSEPLLFDEEGFEVVHEQSHEACEEQPTMRKNQRNELFDADGFEAVDEQPNEDFEEQPTMRATRRNEMLMDR